ncbi:hypothetical protein AB0873_06530 [Micromonospora sp. NPDC047707]|uniref:hypothetical protein n=1 Tax=Micromonospora sp. NPDC047707 TaxID=3154498 RepID=UPI003453493E
MLPLVGLLLAARADDAYWRRHFVGAGVGVVAVYLVTAVASSMVATTLIGHTPADEEPAPRITQCIPVSGGRGCPGG